jgi:phosphoglucosamine mutase
MSRKYFGTDGVRGRVGDHPITADWILKLGRAAGIVLAGNDKRGVVIGKDTRVSGYMFESALEAGLAAAGADVLLLGPMPTPAVAYLTRTLYACAGIVISASHNPYQDNGIKFFSADGEKLPDEVEREIERELDQPFVTVDAAHMGKAARVDDAAGRYIEFCKGTMPFGTLLNGLRIALDCAHGSTYKVAPAVLRELGAKVHVIGNQPDGMNINDHCGSTQPQAMQEHVIQSGADLGIALDGDGDRLVMADRHGNLVDGDELLFINHGWRCGRDCHDKFWPRIGLVQTRYTVCPNRCWRSSYPQGAAKKRLDTRGRSIRPSSLARPDKHRGRNRQCVAGSGNHGSQRQGPGRAQAGYAEIPPDHGQCAGLGRRAGEAFLL